MLGFDLPNDMFEMLLHRLRHLWYWLDAFQIGSKGMFVEKNKVHVFLHDV